MDKFQKEILSNEALQHIKGGGDNAPEEKER